MKKDRNKIIVFDIDDTLNNFAQLYMQCALEYDKTLRNSGIIKPDSWVSNAFDWDEDEKLEFRKKTRSYVHMNSTVKTGALELLHKLKKEYQIYFLTARRKQDFDMMYDGTYEWLIKNNVPFDKLIVDPNKVDYLKTLENVVTFVDDSYSNCLKVSEVRPDIKIYLFNTKNNINKVTDLERVNSWHELAEKLRY